jgi:signal transduction histidine kinase
MPEHPTVEELLAYPLFQLDDREAIEWLAGQFTVETHPAGAVVVKEGDPADAFIFLLEGEIHFRQEADAYGNIFVRRKGQPTGVLPFSRMKTYAGRGIAVQPSRIAAMPATLLRELVYRAPNLAQQLVGEMTDRTRESARMGERRNKMLALGKLSAGLAHELNNPAAAAVRSSGRLREVLMERRRILLEFRASVIPPEAQAILTDLNQKLSDCVDSPGAFTLDPLEKADREADMSDFLESAGVAGDIAADLVEAGITVAQLQPLRQHLPPGNLQRGLKILACDFQILCLARELEEASSRISNLVQAVKQYSYMDRTPLSEVNIAEGIDVTLRMFQHQLKHGVKVKRHYDPAVPKLSANGSELNQVWTNLIDNALDAMGEAENRILEIRTALEPTGVLIEIIDNGPGIPPDVQARMFEPFYTTKPVGEGTGLGLDIVQRIIHSHKGSIRVESAPGRTVFQVRLPLPQ